MRKPLRVMLRDQVTGVDHWFEVYRSDANQLALLRIVDPEFPSEYDLFFVEFRLEDFTLHNLVSLNDTAGESQVNRIMEIDWGPEEVVLKHETVKIVHVLKDGAGRSICVSPKDANDRVLAVTMFLGAYSATHCGCCSPLEVGLNMVVAGHSYGEIVAIEDVTADI